MKTSTILKKAKALIADPANHISATNQIDGSCPPITDKDNNRLPKFGDPAGCKFCAWGALMHLGEQDFRSRAIKLADIVTRDIFGRVDVYSLIRANDDLGYDAVHIVLDEAIKRAKADGD